MVAGFERGKEAFLTFARVAYTGATPAATSESKCGGLRLTLLGLAGQTVPAPIQYCCKTSREEKTCIDKTLWKSLHERTNESM